MYKALQGTYIYMDCDSFQPGLGRLESIETRTNFKFDRVRGAFHHVGSRLLYQVICRRFAEVARSPSKAMSIFFKFF